MSAPIPASPVPVHRLPAWQRRSLYGSGALLLATGSVWLLVHYGRGADDLPGALEAWLMRAHGLFAFCGLFMLGVIAAWHVPHGWRLSVRQGWDGQRSTGILLCVLAAALALTGYALYYFAPEGVRGALGWAHAAIGAAMAALVASHRRGV